MHEYHRDGDFSPLTMSPTTESDNTDFFQSAHSRQTSSCMQSTTSQEPVPTRDHLLETLHRISAFALHYADVYYAIGCSYHILPLSARQSRWVTQGMAQKAAEALITSSHLQLPDLVHLFNEIGHRLDNAQWMLRFSYEKQWMSAEIQLRRCDMLLQEAEIRLRFLQGAVGSMWYAVGRDKDVTWTENERLIGVRALLKKDWASILPQMCFAHTSRELSLNGVAEHYEWRQRW